MLNLPIILAVIAVMIVLGVRRASILTWALAWFVGMLLFLKYGFKVPIPASVQSIYLGVTLAAIFGHAWCTAARSASWWARSRP